MQSFRKGHGMMFRVPVHHKPTPIEVSQQAFDPKPPVYEPIDIVEYHFNGEWFAGELYVGVGCYPPDRERFLVVPPFHVPEGKRHLIPAFPEED
jgi:hypothetical protein